MGLKAEISDGGRTPLVRRMPRLQKGSDTNETLNGKADGRTGTGDFSEL